MAGKEFLVMDSNFAVELRSQIYEQVGEIQTQLQKKVVREAVKLLYERTPKKTGNAVYNWQVSVTNPITSERFGSDLSGEKIKLETEVVLKTLKEYETVWIVNNCNYIEKLENGV